MTQPINMQQDISEAMDALEYLTKDGDYNDEGLAAIRTLRTFIQSAAPAQPEASGCLSVDDANKIKEALEVAAGFALIAEQQNYRGGFEAGVVKNGCLESVKLIKDKTGIRDFWDKPLPPAPQIEGE